MNIEQAQLEVLAMTCKTLAVQGDPTLAGRVAIEALELAGQLQGYAQTLADAKPVALDSIQREAVSMILEEVRMYQGDNAPDIAYENRKAREVVSALIDNDDTPL